MSFGLYSVGTNAAPASRCIEVDVPVAAQRKGGIPTWKDALSRDHARSENQPDRRPPGSIA
jgi:hypothetical protein